MRTPLIPRRFRRPKARLRLEPLPPDAPGPVHPKIAAIHPNPAAAHLEIAAIHPELTAIHPELTAIHPELTAIHPELTAIHPELVEGCLIRLQITLLPMEPFRVRSGRLELTLLTTNFVPTVLDGYYEHTSEKLYQTIPLCESAAANPGDALQYCAELRLPPDAPLPDPRPTRRQWQARARFAVDGYRDLWTVHLLRDASPRQGGPPIVDGRGFLPL